MQRLPDGIVNRILLFMRHPCAEIIRNSCSDECGECGCMIHRTYLGVQIIYADRDAELICWACMRDGLLTAEPGMQMWMDTFATRPGAEAAWFVLADRHRPKWTHYWFRIPRFYGSESPRLEASIQG